MKLNTCRCDCCDVEERREGSETGVDRYECAYSVPGTLWRATGRAENEARADKCGEMCMQISGDMVLTSAETPQMDTQRFCFFECQPIGATPIVGDYCGPMTHAEQHSVRAGDGNGEPPMEIPKTMSHFLANRKVQLDTDEMAALAANARRAARKKANHESLMKADVNNKRNEIEQESNKLHSAMKVKEVGPWASVADPAPELSAKVAEWAQAAEDQAAKAAKDAKSVAKIASAGASALPGAFSMVEDARNAAIKAHKDEESVRVIFETTRSLIDKEALSVVAGEVKTLQKKYRKEAKKWAMEVAKKKKEEMLAEVPAAAEAAKKPYTEAMNRAAAMAAEYAKRGDGLAGASASMQMNAQLTMGSANTYLSLGNLPLAQKLMQQSRQELDLAGGLNGAANSNYDTAGSIVGTLPAYIGQGLAAAYHASVLLNPDTPPAASPLVLMQKREALRKSFSKAPHNGAKTP